MSAPSDLRPRPSLPGRVPLASRGLLAAVATLLAVVALSDLAAAFVGFRIHTLTDPDRGLTTLPPELADAYSLYETVSRYQVTLYLPCAILFIVWFFLMRRATGLLAPDQFRRGPGWAIGAWLIPLVNLWMPYRISVDMWGASTLLPTEGQSHRTSIWPVNLWWVLFVFSVLFGRLAASRYDSAETLAQIHSAVAQYVAADLSHAAAGAAAIYFAFRLTTMQRRKVTDGPYQAGLPA
ncbi:DUF4328 domain-containing protein [Streptomyces sp. NPDC093568]|uniref:DUF4328 domain-containing protein n=1 Tax=Streptomyces sp. NPDC093568 TaxID=3366041 RepID=UPI00380FC466